jgi:hypothetical protein
MPKDDERIKEQISDTKALIEREIQEFNKRHKTQLLAEECPRKEEAKDEAVETEGDHHAESSPVPPVAQESDSTNPLPSMQEQAPKSGNDYATAEKDMLEENGEVVVEGDEDTVIY